MPRVLACLGILVCLLAAAGTADAKTKWLCKPGAKPNPCVGDLTASVIDANGAVVRTERTPVAKAPRVDCFYVYPTVSSQTTTNANLNVDPEETAIAEIEGALARGGFGRIARPRSHPTREAGCDVNARARPGARLLTLPGPSRLLGRRGGSGGKTSRRRGRAGSSEGSHQPKQSG